MVKVAVLGYGTVGTGVVEVIHANRELLKERIGQSIDVKYILVRREIPDCSVREKLTQDFEKILTDPEISIVAEVMGGIEPAFTYAKRCLEAGKSVVTSNKELVAKHGDELIALAQKRQVQFLFEGSVAGGIPVIRTLAETTGVNLSVLAWSLAMGTDIGGSATPIGASANVVGTSVAVKHGYKVTWGRYCRHMAPASIAVLLLSTLLVWVRYF